MAAAIHGRESSISCMAQSKKYLNDGYF
jgi:hypothetical protein